MQSPDFNVAGRVALFTGAGRGIGLAMARALAAGGGAVAIQDIDADVARAEADKINADAAATAAGGRAIGLGGDLTDVTLPERLVDQTTAAFGPISILVNNGSIQFASKFAEHTLEQMQQVFAANLIAATRLCQLVVPAMQEAKWGRFVNMGSIQGKGSSLWMAPYAMTRAAMPNLTQGLAKSYAKDGITANCIAPGWFDTWRNRGDLKDGKTVEERGRHLPVGRLGRPDDCSGLFLLLCSRAGEYITGQTIYVDGGMGL